MKIIQKEYQILNPFVNDYNWEGIYISSHQDGQESEKPKNMLINYKKFEQNNDTIALNILYVPHNKKEIRTAYESKNTERKARHESSGYSLSLICSFDSTKNKHYV